MPGQKTSERAASNRTSKLRPHSDTPDIPEQTGWHQTGHSSSGWAGKASDRTFQLKPNSIRPDIQAQTRLPLASQSNSDWKPSRQTSKSTANTALGSTSSDQSSNLGRNSPSQDWTASSRTSKLRPGIPPRTRHIIISDRTSSDSQAHLRSDWQATAPAQTSKFTLDNPIQATLFCRRAAIEQTRSDQISKLRLDIRSQVRSCQAAQSRISLDIQAQTRQLQTRHTISK